MIVRRYVVKDMPEAVVMIRKDLGKDAVILSTKRVSLKKWMGIVRTRRIEVLAAAGDDIPMRASIPQFQLDTAPRPAASPAAANSGVSKQAGGPKLKAESQSVPDSQTVIAGTPSASVASASPGTFSARATQPTTVAPERTVPPLGQTGVAGDGSDEATAHNLAAAGPVSPMRPVMFKDSSASVDANDNAEVANSFARDELSVIRRMLERVLADGNSAWGKLVRHLLAQGLREETLWSLVQEDRDRFGPEVNGSALGEWTGERIADTFRANLFATLGDISDAQPIRPSSRVVAFVGPTGVGKTTTIAKLAALQVLSGGRKVGLITADTFRIAAIEQMRTYANILNLPLEVVYRAEEMAAAVERLADRDLILVDTAGRNFRLGEHVEEVRDILVPMLVDETYLVLSVTSKPEDLEQLAAAFSTVRIDKFLFTKMDETSTYGSILGLLLRYRKPMSYITTGQNVPDDIEIASLNDILKLIFEGVA